jgi:hypothetical protein
MGSFFLYRLRHKHRYDVKDTTVQILKAFVVTPWLRACERYYCTALIFVVTLLFNRSLSFNNICMYCLIINNITITDAQ